MSGIPRHQVASLIGAFNCLECSVKTKDKHRQLCSPAGVGGGCCAEPALTNQQPTAGSLLKGRRPRDKQTRPEGEQGGVGKGLFLHRCSQPNIFIKNCKVCIVTDIPQSNRAV